MLESREDYNKFASNEYLRLSKVPRDELDDLDLAKMNKYRKIHVLKQDKNPSNKIIKIKPEDKAEGKPPVLDSLTDTLTECLRYPYSKTTHYEMLNKISVGEDLSKLVNFNAQTFEAERRHPLAPEELKPELLSLSEKRISDQTKKQRFDQKEVVDFEQLDRAQSRQFDDWKVSQKKAKINYTNEAKEEIFDIRMNMAGYAGYIKDHEFQYSVPGSKKNSDS
ncbi:hypothetical protein Ciccas_011549 [Cichlidogyrus casuarinus]|uniref:Pre-mRNA-splicing factor SYF2 n=1 Tax=Cichlidogyrus casuarinus TaxID=1844966 RepID=A0ABD2PRT1_9PLAT